MTNISDRLTYQDSLSIVSTAKLGLELERREPAIKGHSSSSVPGTKGGEAWRKFREASETYYQSLQGLKPIAERHKIEFDALLNTVGEKESALKESIVLALGPHLEIRSPAEAEKSFKSSLGVLKGQCGVSEGVITSIFMRELGKRISK